MGMLATVPTTVRPAMPPTTKKIRRDNAPKTPMDTRSRGPTAEIPLFFMTGPFFLFLIKTDTL